MKSLGAVIALLGVLAAVVHLAITPSSLAWLRPQPVVIVLPPNAPPQPVATERVRVIDKAAVIQRMESEAFLVTTSYQGVATVELERHGRLFGLVDGERVKLLAVGEVSAGVDLRDPDVTVNGQSITVRLPAPTIQSVRLDEDETHIADHELTWWSRTDPALMDETRRIAVDELHKAACEDGLARRAERDSQAAVARLLEGLAEAVEVEVQPSQMCNA